MANRNDAEFSPKSRFPAMWLSPGIYVACAAVIAYYIFQKATTANGNSTQGAGRLSDSEPDKSARQSAEERPPAG